jgi:phytoene synthase
VSQSRIAHDQSNGAPLAGSLDDAYDFCRQVTRHHAKSFYFCAQFLPAAKRRAIYAVYALCRTIDDFVDRAADRDASDTRTILDAWRAELRDDRGDGHPALRAWRDAATAYRIPAEHAEELMRGVLMDLGTVRYATYADLELYCYRVASVVGLMTSEIFGYSDSRALDRAVDLGLAMQLTNICRDVGEDAAMGRIYIPADELERFGVSDEALLSRRVEGRFVDLMQFQIARARALYRAAEPGIEMLSPDCRYTVRLSSRVYGKILDAIERNGYDVLSRRAYVPLPRKLAALPSVFVETHLPFARH